MIFFIFAATTSAPASREFTVMQGPFVVSKQLWPVTAWGLHQLLKAGMLLKDMQSVPSCSLALNIPE